MRTRALATVPVVLWALAGASSAAPEAERPFYYERELTAADLEGRSLRELAILRSTIYAHAGQTFHTPWLREYFARESWYKAAPVLNRKGLTSIDLKNVKLIAAYEVDLSREELGKRRDALAQAPAPLTGVSEVALSPDGLLALVAETGGAVRLWQLQGSRVVYTLAEPGRPVAFAAGFFPEGSRAWTLQDDGKLIIWDVASGKEQRKLTITLAPGEGRRAAVAPDGKRMAVADSAMLRMWDLMTGKEIWKVPANEPVHVIAFTPDSKFIFIGVGQSFVERDAALGYEQLKLEGKDQLATQLSTLSAIALSQDGARAVLGGSGWVATLEFASGSMNTTAEVRPEATREAKYHVFLRPDGKTMLAAAQPGRLWMQEEGKTEPKWRRRLASADIMQRFAAALSADGKRIFLGSPDVNLTGWDLELWDTDTGQSVSSWTGPTQAVLERRLINRALGEKNEGSTNPLDDLSVLDRALTADDLKDLSVRDLRLVRSTIAARHGKRFKSELLKDYFGRMTWYKEDPAYRDTLLTAIDKKNLALLQGAEKTLLGKGAPKTPPSEDSWFVESD